LIPAARRHSTALRRVASRCASYVSALGSPWWCRTASGEAVANDYAEQAERASVQPAKETGAVLTPRAVLFAFVNQDGMADAERVIGGRTTDGRDPHAGYAGANTIWLDGEQHPNASDRAQAVGHEFSHLFTPAVVRGKHVPSWFSEGLAVHSEVNLSADLYPAAAELRDGEYRTYVLDAASEEFPRPLFEMSEISNADEDGHEPAVRAGV
jgi:hypothetical protein